MANICEYKVIVKGKRNACHAYAGSMPSLEGVSIASESGTDDDYKLCFEGSCKWDVDYGCGEWDGDAPVNLPEDAEEAFAYAAKNYYGYTVCSRSGMFGVEVLCKSSDFDVDEDDDYYVKSEHYLNGNDDDYEDIPLDEDDVKENYYEDKEYFDNVAVDDDDEFAIGFHRDFREKDRIKAYYSDNKLTSWNRKFNITFQNPVLTSILEEYKYSSEAISDVCSFELKPILPHYAGVQSLEELTMTLINIFVDFGSGADGLKNELKSRKDEIAKSFAAVSGRSTESGLKDELLPFDDIIEGFCFKLVDGEYKATPQIRSEHYWRGVRLLVRKDQEV